MVFSVFTKLCNHHHNRFYIFITQNLYPLSSHCSLSPLLSPLAKPSIYFFATKEYSIIWTYYILFIHLWIVIWVVSIFWLLWIMLWTFIYMFCVHIFFKPLGYIPRTARLFGNSVFNFFWYETVFQSSCIILYSHQQQRRAGMFPNHCQHVLLPIFLITAILVGLKW